MYGEMKYYKDLTHGFFVAYEKTTEFFVTYLPETKKWVDCAISFSYFKHDYDFIEISKEELAQNTNGNFPDDLFQEYLNLLRKNEQG